MLIHVYVLCLCLSIYKDTHSEAPHSRLDSDGGQCGRRFFLHSEDLNAGTQLNAGPSQGIGCRIQDWRVGGSKP